ncbi:hypothetical protein AGMMS49959_17960 [Planctomycetales bacterium]|nr:hypothetical protein AGMMS49959_17900 [Planctomycetales bacterium]GHV23768.1 hypothetical protein AGMMS49959_17960 [Planctomycetales bacterium]
MRIGIYGGNARPDAGGAYTLFETVKKDISATNGDDEVFFFFADSSLPEEFSENKIFYVNLSRKKRKKRLAYKIKRILHKIKRVLSKRYRRQGLSSLFDDILHEKQIDLLWLLGPYEVDTTVPYVFTVWDLGHRLLPCFPEMSTVGWKWDCRENLYQKMLYRATYIITGNKTGKQEILANYPVPAAKIHTIPFPIPNFCFDNDDGKEGGGIKSPFIFYPAQFWAHKNHIALVAAIAWLRDTQNTFINCYFVGADYGNLDNVKAAIRQHRLEKQVEVLGFVERPTLAYLYRNALAMTYVSLLGPNNLPPLEAAAYGCPLILSNIAGHIEQMEGAGVLVDATNPVAIGEAILKIYENPPYRQSLITAELALAQKYKNYSYFHEMQKIITAYALLCKTWKYV